jgi:hypothetical protein
MAEEEIKICMDIEIPVAAEEMAVTNKWKNGKQLRVHFYDGDAEIQRKVRSYAEKWQEFANIGLNFVNDPEAEIRVSFKMDGTSWSAVGTDALNKKFFPEGAPTMNFGWLKRSTPDEDYSRAVLHEFGHALGCIHEHQNPAGGIPWNKEAVYRYYDARGWSREKVNQNLFRKYAKDKTQFTAFDRDSIMLYPIPKELTDGKLEVGWNRVLSPTDTQFIGEMYPKK